MKTIIAGSRTIEDFNIVDGAIAESGFTITEVVSGCARGVDRIGEEWAFKLSIPVKRFVADWMTLGKVAGIVRNEEMAAYADALIAVWDGQSRGTLHMINCAKKSGLKVFVKIPTPLEPELKGTNP